jgi:hypothetical protein
LVEVLAPISGDAAEQDVVMAALDDVDGVDLNVAEVSDRSRRSAGAVPKRSFHIEPLGVQPDTACLSFGEDYGNGEHWL